MSRTGVVAALEAEARCLGRPPRQAGLWPAPDGLLVAVTGMGPGAAAAGARQLLAAGCDRLVSFGMAGGLDPTLAAGTVLLPAVVRDADGATRVVDERWRRNLGTRLQARGLVVVAGELLSVAAPLATRQDKARAFAGGAMAVDMESFAVAAVAALAGRPFLAARVVTDTAADALPPVVGAALDERGEARLPRLLAGLLRHPGQLPALLALSRRYGAALRALRTVAGCGLAGEEA